MRVIECSSQKCLELTYQNRCLPEKIYRPAACISQYVAPSSCHPLETTAYICQRNRICTNRNHVEGMCAKKCFKCCKCCNRTKVCKNCKTCVACICCTCCCGSDDEQMKNGENCQRVSRDKRRDVSTQTDDRRYSNRSEDADWEQNGRTKDVGEGHSEEHDSQDYRRESENRRASRNSRASTDSPNGDDGSGFQSRRASRNPEIYPEDREYSNGERYSRSERYSGDRMDSKRRSRGEYKRSSRDSSYSQRSLKSSRRVSYPEGRKDSNGGRYSQNKRYSGDRIETSERRGSRRTSINGERHSQNKRYSGDRTEMMSERRGSRSTSIRHSQQRDSVISTSPPSSPRTSPNQRNSYSYHSPPSSPPSSNSPRRRSSSANRSGLDRQSDSCPACNEYSKGRLRQRPGSVY